MVSVFICAASLGFSGARIVKIPSVNGLPAPHPLALSADGKTVVGQFAPGNPFTWRGGTDTARFRPSSNVNILDQYAHGVSANGNFIVGKAGGAYIWSRGKGFKTIGDSSSFAFGVSEDGSTIACQVEGKKNRRGFLWSENGTINLEAFAPTCISGNGKVAAGIQTNHGVIKAFYYHNQVSEELAIPESFSDSTAFAVSRDGATIVGSVIDPKGTFAAAWFNGKFSKLESLGQTEAVARSITRDGSYIGGYAGSEAVVWNHDGKANYLEMILKGSGAPVTGWKFESVNGIARVGDRVYLTGWGHFNGKDAGYYASFHID